MGMLNLTLTLVTLLATQVLHAMDAGGSDSEVAIKVLANRAVCGEGLQEGVSLIANDQLTLIQQAGMLSPNEGPKINANLKENTGAIFVIYRGKFPSTGYRLHLLNNKLLTEGKKRVLQVHVEWQEPREGMRHAQMMTSPCLVFDVPQKVHFEVLKVIDQNAKVIGTVNVEESL